MASFLPTSKPKLTFAVLVISAGVLGLELSLMRLLVVASWHHFAFLVISMVLLGFGTSGSVIFLLHRWIRPRIREHLYVFALLASIFPFLCVELSQHIPIEAQFAPALVWKQVGYWISYWIVLAIPFFFAASVICTALMIAEEDLPWVYGANLIGSALGALLVTLSFQIVPLRFEPVLWGTTMFLGSLFLLPERRKRMFLLLAITGTVILCFQWKSALSFELQADPSKYSSYIKRLEEEGRAKKEAELFSHRGIWQAYSSDVFHDIPFLAPLTSPPRMHSLLHDGHSVGSILEISALEEAQFLKETLMDLPYSFVRQDPTVLLLSETGGVNVWLALVNGAKRISVVHPDRNLFRLHSQVLEDNHKKVFEFPPVEKIVATPRHFLAQTTKRYDLIQLVQFQSLAVGSGLRGLGEDYLFTVEGLSTAFSRLRENGILFACRGIQTPPRDNLKFLATMVQVIEKIEGVTPKNNILIYRDYLALCTVVRKEAWRSDEISVLRNVLDERVLTPVWFPGIRHDELNTPDELPGPTGGTEDWYYHAAKELFSENSEEFIDQWVFHLTPATDDSPFFFDFFRVKTFKKMLTEFGSIWLTRVELAFLFVVASLGIIALLALVFTCGPLLLLSRNGREKNFAIILAYFGAIGLGYMLLEISFLSRLIHIVGDPITAAAVTITGFLFWSGIGSITSNYFANSRRSMLPKILMALVFIGLTEIVLLDNLAALLITNGIVIKVLVSLLIIMPLGLLMGFAFQLGLLELKVKHEHLIPWAWGVNGFASVLAPPLAMALAMSVGFRFTCAVALSCYALAATLFSIYTRYMKKPGLKY